VRAPDGSVRLDTTGRAAGRGAYLCDDPACFETATRRRALEHALGVSVPAGLIGYPTAAPPTSDPAPTIPGAQPPVPGAIPDPMTRGDSHGQE
jgi:hypothetical protein